MTANINEKTVKLPPVRVFRGDDGGDTITFECARAYGALDLSAASAFMKFLRSDWYAEKVPLQKSADETAVRFDWKIDKKQTAVAGPLRMQVVFEGEDFVFQTEVFTLDVLPSLTGAEYETREDFMALVEKQLAGYVKRAEMEAFVEEKLEGAAAPDLSEYVKESQLEQYAQKSELSALATKEELTGYATADALSGYATAEDIAGFVTESELSGAIAGLNSAMGIVQVSAGSPILDAEPDQIYLYSEPRDFTQMILVNFPKDTWKAGDRGMIVFSKLAVGASPAIEGLYGYPLVMCGDGCNGNGELMGEEKTRYWVDLFCDGTYVMGKVSGWKDPDME